jgi:hypothetical protein
MIVVHTVLGKRLSFTSKEHVVYTDERCLKIFTKIGDLSGGWVEHDKLVAVFPLCNVERVEYS